MARPPAVNASPLIFLAKAGLVDFLRHLAEPILVIPSVVAEELERRGLEDPTVQAVHQTPWLEVVEAPPVPPAIQAWDLGPGESSVLAWCHASPGTQAIIDDLAGRKCARAFGIPVKGTLGIVLLAKHNGLIPAARPVLEKLRRSGMYLSNRVLDQALARFDE